MADVRLLPTGGTLDEEAFRNRHALLRNLLVLHLPALLAVGVLHGAGVLRAGAEVLGPLACAVVAGRLERRAPAAAAVALGMVLSSGALVRLTDGAVEARFHLFVVLGFVALYQAWAPLLSALAGATATLVAGAAIAAEATFGTGDPWRAAAVHGAAVAAATAAQLLCWRAIEAEHRRGTRLSAELARAQSQIEARESVSELFVNLARRNQALLDRQLDLIVGMEEREADPDQLAQLFALDHLATRIRRNAESLLVLSGEEPARRWGRPVALADVVRAAVAEVEDYRRADVVVEEGVAVTGRAVADVAHLLAELVENGLQFSPPETRVRIASSRRPDGACALTVEDRGIGLGGVELSSANDLLARAPEVDLRLSKRLGFHVVSRLAARYGIRVQLGPTPGGGLTATVVLPGELLAPAEVGVAPPAELREPTSSASGRRPHRTVSAPAAPAPAPAAMLRTAPAPSPVVEVVAAAGTVEPRPVTVATAPHAPVTVPSVPPAAPSPPGAAGPDPAPGGLPRRVPQASLHPHLARTLDTGAPVPPGRPAATAIPTTVAVGGARRHPDEVRTRLSSFQAGQQRGRSAVRTVEHEEDEL